MKIIIGILMTFMAFGLTTTEIQGYDVSWVTDTDNNFSMTNEDVNMTYSFTSTGTKTFYLQYSFQQFFNGMAIWNYDGDASLDNGGLPNGFYEIESGINARYQHLYIGSLHFQVYEYDYEFQITHNSNDTFTLNWVGNGTNDPRYSSSSIVYNYAQGSQSHWIYVYDSLYNETLDFLTGVQAGLIDGFNDGRDYYAYEDNGTFYTAAYWGNQRYNDGLSQGESNSLAIQNMIPGILGVMFAFFFQLASISVLGVTALDLIALLFGVGIVLLILKVLVK
jgi:hypothetical protein